MSTCRLLRADARSDPFDRSRWQRGHASVPDCRVDQPADIDRSQARPDVSSLVSLCIMFRRRVSGDVRWTGTGSCVSLCRVTGGRADTVQHGNTRCIHPKHAPGGLLAAADLPVSCHIRYDSSIGVPAVLQSRSTGERRLRSPCSRVFVARQGVGEDARPRKDARHLIRQDCMYCTRFAVD